MSNKTKNIDGIGEVRFSKRKGQRSISISLKPGYVRVSMPHATPFFAAEKFVLSKRSWILKHQVQKNTLQDGAGIGKHHTLKIEEARQKTHVRDGIVYAPDNANLIEKAAYKALKLECEQLITPMLTSLAEITGLTPSDIGYKPTKSRWGSCSSKQYITISTLLIQLPWELIEYVLIHELCHTKEMNHGPGFWALVEQHCPDHKARRKLLKGYSPQFYDTSSAI